MDETRARLALDPDGSIMKPVLRRLCDTAPCSAELKQMVVGLGSRIEVAAVRTLLQNEDDRVVRPRYLVSGWACRLRHLSDGRRQIFDLILPGEGVGIRLRPSPLANTSTIALTTCRLADASALLQYDSLRQELTPFLQAQADADERRMLNQIVRLGRQAALERMAHLLLELRDRLAVIGAVSAERFPLPLTQETLADLLGLSVVHVNRTLQELRRQGLVAVGGGHAKILDLAAAKSLADYGAARG